MNKVTLKKAFIAFCVSVFAVFFATCAEELDNNDNNKQEKDFEIAGIWHFINTSKNNEVYKIEFAAAKTFEITGGMVGSTPRSIKGNWSVKGSEVTTTITNANGTAMPASVSETYTASKSGSDVLLTLKGGAQSLILSSVSMAGTSITLKPGAGGVVEGEPAPVLSQNERWLYRPIEGTNNIKLAGVVWIDSVTDGIFADVSSNYPYQDRALSLDVLTSIDGFTVTSIANDFSIYNNDSSDRKALGAGDVEWRGGPNNRPTYIYEITLPNTLTSIEPKAFETVHNADKTLFSVVRKVDIKKSGLDFSGVVSQSGNFWPRNWFTNGTTTNIPANGRVTFIEIYNANSKAAGVYKILGNGNSYWVKE